MELPRRHLRHGLRHHAGADPADGRLLSSGEPHLHQKPPAGRPRRRRRQRRKQPGGFRRLPRRRPPADPALRHRGHLPPARRPQPPGRRRGPRDQSPAAARAQAGNPRPGRGRGGRGDPRLSRGGDAGAVPSRAFRVPPALLRGRSRGNHHGYRQAGRLSQDAAQRRRTGPLRVRLLPTLPPARTPAAAAASRASGRPRRCPGRRHRPRGGGAARRRPHPVRRARSGSGRGGAAGVRPLQPPDPRGAWRTFPSS